VRRFDVFNGDADGLCALQQLQLAEPADSVLVSGPKRDIELLARVNAQRGDRVTVLDVSLERNRIALQGLLARGVQVRYFDHHYAGTIPGDPLLEAHIETGADVCTSILVDRYLGGRYRAWAVVAAFGDNLATQATELARTLALEPAALNAMRELGEALNYNAYGETQADLMIAPAQLFERMRGFADPLRFAADDPIARQLAAAKTVDLGAARDVVPTQCAEQAAVFVLPDAAWSRRVIGTFANELATSTPARAHAVLAPNGRQGYTVSVRAPLAHPAGADAFCRDFTTGGGRKIAAGIEHLPESDLPRFIARFMQHPWARAR
jgi:hypothetical protein